MRERCNFLVSTYHSINCFDDEGKLDLQDLDRLITAALRDGIMDSRERRALGRILTRVSPSKLNADMRERLAELRTKYGISGLG